MALDEKLDIFSKFSVCCYPFYYKLFILLHYQVVGYALPPLSSSCLVSEGAPPASSTSTMSFSPDCVMTDFPGCQGFLSISLSEGDGGGWEAPAPESPALPVEGPCTPARCSWAPCKRSGDIGGAEVFGPFPCWENPPCAVSVQSGVPQAVTH